MVAKKEQIKGKPKETTIRTRVDDEILKKLDYCAGELNTTRSNVMRKGIEMVYNDLKENKKE